MRGPAGGSVWASPSRTSVVQVGAVLYLSSTVDVVPGDVTIPSPVGAVGLASSVNGGMIQTPSSVGSMEMDLRQWRACAVAAVGP